MGKDGVVEVEEGKTWISPLTTKKEWSLIKAMLLPYFVTDTDNMEAVIKNPYILVTDQKIS